MKNVSLQAWMDSARGTQGGRHQTTALPTHGLSQPIDQGRWCFRPWSWRWAGWGEGRHAGLLCSTPVHTLFTKQLLCVISQHLPRAAGTTELPNTLIAQEETDLSHSTYTPSRGGENVPERTAEVWADNMQDWLRKKYAVPHSHVFTGRQGLSWETRTQPRARQPDPPPVPQ